MMSIDVFSRIRQVADMQFAVATRLLLEHADEWEQVESWLEDEASRVAYRKELVFWALRTMFGFDVAIEHAGALSRKDWNAAVERMREALERGEIPPFESGLPEDHRQLLFARTTGFILNQYDYKGLVGVRQGDVVLDCGACFGETALWARMQGADKVYSFEPNPETFGYLKQNADHYNKPDAPWLFPVPSAVGDKEETLPFMQEPDHPGGCGFAENGNIQVPVTTLDLWCEQNGIVPDFIKMDLEGAEGMALLGAEKTFRTYKPRFAVCLYHRLEDMWMLPRILKLFVPEYRFWCKKSAPECEFVLFGAVE